MGKSKRSKAIRIKRNQAQIKDLFDAESKKLECLCAIYNNHLFEFNPQIGGATQISCKGINLGTFKVIKHILIGDYLCLKLLNKKGWFCYDSNGECIHFNDFIKKSFFIKEDFNKSKLDIYYFNELHQLKQFECREISYTYDSVVIFRLENNECIVMNAVWFDVLLTNIIKYYNYIYIDSVYDNNCTQNKEEAFIAIGNGKFKSLGVPTRRMERCYCYNLPYYTGIERFFHPFVELELFMAL